MNETTNNDLLPFSDSAIEDWGSIFGASAGIWDWWRGIAHVTGDWNTPGVVCLVVDDPNDEDAQIAKTFEPADIFRALAKATELYPWHFTRHGEERYLDLDAASADVVLQVALFGEAVYG